MRSRSSSPINPVRRGPRRHRGRGGREQSPRQQPARSRCCSGSTPPDTGPDPRASARLGHSDARASGHVPSGGYLNLARAVPGAVGGDQAQRRRAPAARVVARRRMARRLRHAAAVAGARSPHRPRPRLPPRRGHHSLQQTSGCRAETACRPPRAASGPATTSWWQSRERRAGSGGQGVGAQIATRRESSSDTITTARSTHGEARVGPAPRSRRRAWDAAAGTRGSELERLLRTRSCRIRSPRRIPQTGDRRCLASRYHGHAVSAAVRQPPGVVCDSSRRGPQRTAAVGQRPAIETECPRRKPAPGRWRRDGNPEPGPMPAAGWVQSNWWAGVSGCP